MTNDPQAAAKRDDAPGAGAAPGVFPDGFTLRDEANAIIAITVRNEPIEHLHAGKYSPLLEDPA